MYIFLALEIVHVGVVLTLVDQLFCLTQSCSDSAPKKYTEVYINYKLIILLAHVSN